MRVPLSASQNRMLRQGIVLWVALAVLVVGLLALRIGAAGRFPVQTDLLALLPATERNPLAERAVEQLAAVSANRAVFLLGHADAEQARGAARSLAKRLAAGAGFARVHAEIPAAAPRQLLESILPYRFGLLSEADRQTLVAGEVDLQQRLLRKLYQPMRLGPAADLADDPFGFTDAWLAAHPLLQSKLRVEQGFLQVRAGDQAWVLVIADLAGSAYDAGVQSAVRAATDAARQQLAEQHAGVELLRTGPVFYADAAQRTAQAELDAIGAGSLAGMLLLLYLAFRSWRPLALGTLCVLFGIATAVAGTLLIHGQLHLITLVFGASLIGEAVDYAAQYFAAHLGAGTNWHPLAELKRIAPGLAVALATSLLGYAALAWTPFPALAQIGLFAMIGLLAAWISVFLLLPGGMRAPMTRDMSAMVAYPSRWQASWRRQMTRRRCLWLCAALVLAAVPGWLRLASNDDVRMLVTRPADLQAQEERIRLLTGLGNGSQFFLVEGRDFEESLQREERLTAGLRRLVDRGALSGYQAISSAIPSLARQQASRALVEARVFGDAAQLRRLLVESGMDQAVAARYADAFGTSAGHWLRAEDWLRTPLAGAFRHLSLERPGAGWATLVVPQAPRDLEALAQLAGEIPGVVFVDKAGGVGRLFQQYRQWVALWLCAALLIVLGVLGLRYGAVRGLVTLMPAALAMGLALACFGYLGRPLTLFNLMALLLVLGVGVNYAIFLREGGLQSPATLVGVLVSAATTVLSFGLLAFSSMPALSGFGLTLLLGVGLAVMLSPMVISFEPGTPS